MEIIHKLCYVKTLLDDGTSHYARGCQSDSDFNDMKSGCIDTENGSICFKGCRNDNCNTHQNINEDFIEESTAYIASLCSVLLTTCLLY